MSTRSQEIWVGLFVALGAVALVFLALRASNLVEYGGGERYRLHASFENIGGLRVRAPVTMGGVRVGRVGEINYDMQNFRARVTLEIDSQYDQIPQDSTASIRTAGLIGEQFIGLDPGGAPDPLTDGAEIELTQSAMVIEQLIGQFLYGQASGDKNP